jgi:hypothetical protein
MSTECHLQLYTIATTVFSAIFCEVVCVNVKSFHCILGMQRSEEELKTVQTTASLGNRVLQCSGGVYSVGFSVWFSVGLSDTCD